MAIILLLRNIVTFFESNVTMQPVSTIGAMPPSACCSPGTMCAVRDSEVASVVVPDAVAWRVLPSGWIIGEDRGGEFVSGVIKCAWDGG